MLKKVVIQFFILAGILFPISLGFAAELEPPLPANAIFSPTIYWANESHTAGTAWAASLEGKNATIIVTAHHIFGPSGGFSTDIPAEKMAEGKLVVELVDVFSTQNFGKVTKNLYIPDAKSQPPTSKDVAAFLAAEVEKKISIGKLYISDQLPALGEEVWLAASVVGGDPAWVKLHKATVVRSAEDVIMIHYDNPNLVLRATSGAPVLNKEGKVIGLNIAAGKDAIGRLIGILNPCTSFKKMIVDALDQSKN